MSIILTGCNFDRHAHSPNQEVCGGTGRVTNCRLMANLSREHLCLQEYLRNGLTSDCLEYFL